MLRPRRLVATALLVGATMVPVSAAAPAYAVGSSSATVRAAAVGWVLVGTYLGLDNCRAAGSSVAAGRQWQCSPSPSVPSAYDLYVWR